MAKITMTAGALLFDMDGTLVDSNAIVEQSWAVWAQRHQLDLAEILQYSHGRPTLATMEYFGPRIAPGRDWQAEADEMQRYEFDLTGGTVAIAGARELVGQLEGVPWAVVTSAPRGLAERRIQEAGLPLPQVLVPADEIRMGKPDPEGYLKAAGMLGVAAGECVVFEDAAAGVEAGLRAGMRVVGMLTTLPAGRLAAEVMVRDFRNVEVRRAGTGVELVIHAYPFEA